MHQMSVSNVHPVCILIHKTHLLAEIVQRGISPMSHLRQMEKYAMMFVHLVQGEHLEQKNKQRISWKDVKIVPVVNFLNTKDWLTAIAKDAPKENGVLKLVRKRNRSASIASLGNMV